MKRKTMIKITAFIRLMSYKDAERYWDLHDEVYGFWGDKKKNERRLKHIKLK